MVSVVPWTTSAENRWSPQVKPFTLNTYVSETAKEPSVMCRMFRVQRKRERKRERESEGGREGG